MAKNPAKNTKNTSYMVQLALMIALVVAVSFIPVLGYIPLVVIKATTVHIPVIIGAILLGPKAGAMLGLTMGLTSIIKNTIEPSLTSFVFSPFIPMPGTDSGDLRALLIALLPRMLIGVVAGIVYKIVSLFDKKGFAACGLAALLGSLTNTALVLGGIYLMFGEQYAKAINVGFEVLGTYIMGIVATNGLAEAAVAVVLCVLIIRPLTKALNRNRTAKTDAPALAEEPTSADNN
jgi:uncharacterized membrane protein